MDFFDETNAGHANPRSLASSLRMSGLKTSVLSTADTCFLFRWDSEKERINIFSLLFMHISTQGEITEQGESVDV